MTASESFDYNIIYNPKKLNTMVSFFEQKSTVEAYHKFVFYPVVEGNLFIIEKAKRKDCTLIIRKNSILKFPSEWANFQRKFIGVTIMESNYDTKIGQ